jgi:hypothetical protein
LKPVLPVNIVLQIGQRYPLSTAPVQRQKAFFQEAGNVLLLGLHVSKPSGLV